FAIVIGVCPFVNGMMSCLVTSEPRPVPTPVGLAVPSLNPDLSVILCVGIEQLLTESIRAPTGDSFKKIPRTLIKAHMLRTRLPSRSDGKGAPLSTAPSLPTL